MFFVQMDIETFPSFSPSSSFGLPTVPQYDDVWSDECQIDGFFDTDAGKVIGQVLGAISILCCLTIILAVTIPLCDKEERKNMTSYNLYLVYLAIPDLTMSSCFIATVTKCALEDRFLWEITSIAFVANVWVNVVILYELLKLLVDSKSRRRSTPPSLLKASTQALSVYAVSIILGLLEFYIRTHLLLRVFFGCAFVYLLWVLFRVCYGRLLCYNSDTLDRLKVLVIYFSRIICLNMVTAIVYVSVLYSHLPATNMYAWMETQIMIGFGLSLTKPDVLGYVRRLFACSVRPCSKLGSALGMNRNLAPTKLEPSADTNEDENPGRDPEIGDPDDSEDIDANEDGNEFGD
jgi:hypothetical protein